MARRSDCGESLRGKSDHGRDGPARDYHESDDGRRIPLVFALSNSSSRSLWSVHGGGNSLLLVVVHVRDSGAITSIGCQTSCQTGKHQETAVCTTRALAEPFVATTAG